MKILSILMRTTGLKYIKSGFLIVFLIVFSSFQQPPVSEIDLNDISAMVECSENFENYILDFYDEINAEENLSFEAFRYAVIGYYNMKCEGLLKNENLISIIDYTKSANVKRLNIINVPKREIIINSLVAHGRNSGDEMAVHFSNRGGSKMSSIGFFITGETYDGRHEYSLKIDGLESNNCNVRPRGIVFHGADYVCEEFINHSGRIGRSNGCPALPQNLNKKIVDTIKDKSSLFIYYNDEQYLKNSKYLDILTALQQYYSENYTVSN